MNDIGAKLRQLRQQQGLNQFDVASKLNISIPAYSKIESGATDMSLNRLGQIAEIFGTPVSELIGFDKHAAGYLNKGEIASLKAQLLEKDYIIIQLQKTIIDLYTELHKLRAQS